MISNGAPLAIRGHLLNFFKVTTMKKNWTEKDIEQLSKLVDKKTNTELSHIFNVSNSSIEHVLQRYNLKRNSDKYKQKDIGYYEQENNNLGTPCHICTSHQISPNGYPMKKVKGKKSIMARYVYEEYYKKEISKGLMIRHRCDNKLCINPLHLELGTHMDNMQDKIDRNRQHKGEQINTAQLTEQQVREIRKTLAIRKYGDIRRVAKEYAVSTAAISNILRNKTWKHIKI